MYCSTRGTDGQLGQGRGSVVRCLDGCFASLGVDRPSAGMPCRPRRRRGFALCRPSAMGVVESSKGLVVGCGGGGRSFFVDCCFGFGFGFGLLPPLLLELFLDLVLDLVLVWISVPPSSFVPFPLLSKPLPPPLPPRLSPPRFMAGGGEGVTANISAAFASS